MFVTISSAVIAVSTCSWLAESAVLVRACIALPPVAAGHTWSGIRVREVFGISSYVRYSIAAGLIPALAEGVRCAVVRALRIRSSRCCGGAGTLDLDYALSGPNGSPQLAVFKW